MRQWCCCVNYHHHISNSNLAVTCVGMQLPCNTMEIQWKIVIFQSVVPIIIHCIDAVMLIMATCDYIYVITLSLNLLVCIMHNYLQQYFHSVIMTNGSHCSSVLQCDGCGCGRLEGVTGISRGRAGGRVTTSPALIF